MFAIRKTLYNNITTLAFTLIEMLVTITIMMIMLGLAMVNFSKLNSPKEIVDEASNLIVQACNQLIAQSINVADEQVLCNLSPGTGSNLAGCSANTLWHNINNNKFNSKINVSVRGNNNSYIYQIIYVHGLITKVKTANGEVEIHNNNESDIISPITFKVELNDVSNCFNNVHLWPSNVMVIESNCNR